ncbi:hypothetical protein L195_g026959 [Trifolium pratense]|uniref:At2g35280-like TPR domain-containing protein n=1 Tax=Trifolium pratense TaxID=57577 RepID=A0A2K3KXS7_TRIPR|nr:uncharacterized protein LOC123886136 [Trifolium pratense]PNX71088.1 hypothetical protein L195_g026959 [Trifolium pratense]
MANHIDLLPEDILLKMVVEKVATNSFVNFFNMQATDRQFRKLSNNPDVLKKVSFEDYPKILWEPNQNILHFLKRFEVSGNPEVLFSQGLREFFDWPVGNISGLRKLKIAAESGYKPAKYVYGMIKLCSENNESRKEGIDHVRSLRVAKCMMQLRMKMHQISHYFWRYNRMLVRNRTPICNSFPTCKGWGLKRNRWVFVDDEDDDMSLCENCRWDHELNVFYGIFHIHNI